MTIKVIRQTGARFSPSGGSIPYKVTGALDAAEAAAAIASEAPPIFGSLFLDWKNVSAEEETSEYDNPDLMVYHGEAPYVQKPEPRTGETPEFSYEISLEEVTEIYALGGTQGKYARPQKTAPDNKGLMGVTKNGIEGVKIPRPLSKFNETYYLDVDAYDTEAYRALLQKTVGKMNSVPFRGHDPYEVLLLSASGSSKSRDNLQLTLTYAVSESESSLTIGDITGIEKKGWDVLDVQYIEQTDTANNTTIKIPNFVYVHRVFKEIDFVNTLRLT